MNRETTSLAGLVEAQVRLRGSALAAVDPHTTLTYADLWRRAWTVAHQLKLAGVGAHDRVGVSLEGSVHVVVALLGVILAECVVVVLDPSYPAARLTFIADDAGIDVVVADDAALQRLPSAIHQRSILDIGRVSVSSTRPRADVSSTLPRAHVSSALPRAGHELPSASPPGLAYVLYTSGSTGQPKGVMYRADSLTSLVTWQAADSIIGDRGPSRTLQYAPASFDVCFQEVFSTLVAGGTLVCPGTRMRTDPELLSRILAEWEIERAFFPFIALHLLAVHGERAAVAAWGLREVISSGEQVQCNDDIVELFQRHRAVLVNQYGPTETHAALRYRLPGDPATWPRLPPVGTAVRGARLSLDGVADDKQSGHEGELTIAGDIVAQGYLGRPDLTSERFTHLSEGERAYRTGDIVRVDGDGLYHFVGRVDDQIKVRGYRVEPGEIEACLIGCPAVSAAAVVAVGKDGLDRSLYGIIVPATGAAVDSRQIRRFLLERLPHHLVPREFAAVHELPRLPSGKLDRTRIQEIANRHAARRAES